MFEKLKEIARIFGAHSGKAMKRKKAQRRLREIWREEFPSGQTIEEAFITDEPWKWFNIYANLQNHDQTIEAVTSAFTESFERRAKEKHHLEEVIVRGRTELRKRLTEIESLKQKIAELESPAQKKEPR